MTSEQYLQIIAKDHDKWVTMVKTLGEKVYHEDIVQEVYIKIHNNNYYQRIIKDGNVNEGYMFFMVRTMPYDYWRINKKIDKVEIDNNILEAKHECNLEKEHAYLAICEGIDEEIESWYWYDKEVFKIYRMHWRDVDSLNYLLEQFKGNVSIRKIAQYSGISWVTLFNELKESKAKIKELFSEDWEDYINEDYHLINKK